MTTNDDSTFEQKGAAVAAEAGRLAQLSDELESESGKCRGDHEEVGSWITTIGKALLAIFGISAGAGK